MTSRRVLRGLAFGGMSASLVPTVLVLATVHASAAPATFGLYSTTAVVRASGTSGDVGASGGLTPLDSGSASIDAALDNSPTAMVLARPVEPGTSFATVNSQLPTPVTVPQALAAYPGTTQSSSVAPAPTTTATAKVTKSSAQGTAQSAGSGATLGAVTASTSLAATGDGHQVTAVGDAYASGLDAGGVVVIRGVRGHAAISSTADGKRTAAATTTVGSITVAGQAVEVTDDGVHAVGQTVPLGPTLQQLTATANSALSAAGVSLSLAAPIHTVTTSSLGSHSVADSGGLRVTLSTPTVGTSTVPANTATVTLGRVLLTESDSPADDVGPPVAVPTSGPTQGAVNNDPGTPGTPGEPGTVITLPGQGPGTPGIAQPPTVAIGTHDLLLAGRRISPQGAIAALGGWMALTLGSATYAVLALRRPDDEEHLCPCP